MINQVRVNIKALANMAAIRHEQRHGREHIIVPSATLPDNVVMNDILYTAEAIKSSFMGLDQSPAPLGHPKVGNTYVSALSPAGINLGWVGASNENVRQEGGRVHLDKVIDVQVAERSEGGKAVLNAIEAGDPIHTSTGLMCYLDAAESGTNGHKYTARDIEFDHDAILLNEDGAATPGQGVGMMVNASGDKIEVINSVVEQADEYLDWAGINLLDAVERRSQASKWERIKSALLSLLASEQETTTNQKGDVDMADEKQIKELSDKVDGLAETVGGIAEAITNAVKEAMKPMIDNLAEIKANQATKDKAELAVFVNTIVEGGLLDKETAEGLTLNAARALAEKAKPGKAAGMNDAGFGKEVDEFDGVDLNAGMKEAK